MNIYLRVFLIFGALTVLAMIIQKIRNSEIQTVDSISWFFFVGVFVLLATFPQIAFFFSDLLGFESPANFVFLCVVAVVVVKEFTLTSKLAHLRCKVNALTQEIALREKDK